MVSRNELMELLEGMEKRLTDLFNARMTALEDRMTAVEVRMTAMEARMTAVEARMTVVEVRVTAVEAGPATDPIPASPAQSHPEESKAPLNTEPQALPNTQHIAPLNAQPEKNLHPYLYFPPS